MDRWRYLSVAALALFLVSAMAAGLAYCQDDDGTRNILKQGLLGAGTGAIAASASGGKAGQGALIGAGTNVIGSALLDTLTGPSTSQRSAPPQQYYGPPQQYAPQQYGPQQQQYYDDGNSYYEEYYEPPPQESSSQKILKQGLVGAGTGALASGMSGGDAGKGALIGAGTNVIGNALLDTLTQPPQQRAGRVYRRMPPPQQRPQSPQSYQRQSSQQQVVSDDGSEVGAGQKRVIKKYDENGKLVSEEEIYY